MLSRQAHMPGRRHSFLVALLCLAPSAALAWGPRGHAVVVETAARLAAADSDAVFLKTHAEELAYYANVPDLVWKEARTYPVESYQHFMDVEIFERALGADWTKLFETDRLAFDRLHPDVPLSAGRAWWRIRELDDELAGVTNFLRRRNLSRQERHRLQGQWLLLAGVIAHYVGDLSQPLHTTENYDGQLTGQTGAHAVFETEAVNELPARLPDEVWRSARAGMNSDQPGRMAAASSPNEQAEQIPSLMTLVRNLILRAHVLVPEVLRLDGACRGHGAAEHSRRASPLIVERLTDGSRTLALLWRRHLSGWTFDEEGFHAFDPKPAFIPPPGNKPLPPR